MYSNRAATLGKLDTAKPYILNLDARRRASAVISGFLQHVVRTYYTFPFFASRWVSLPPTLATCGKKHQGVQHKVSSLTGPQTGFFSPGRFFIRRQLYIICALGSFLFVGNDSTYPTLAPDLILSHLANNPFNSALKPTLPSHSNPPLASSI